MRTNKSLLKARFTKQYPELRLLAIQLNGFNHTVFADHGHAETDVEVLRWSFFIDSEPKLRDVFEGFFHHAYQGQPKEYVYIYPSLR